MRKTVILGLLASLCFLALASVALSQDKPRIAVLKFENKAGVSWWYGTGAEAAQDVFVTNLVKTGKYRVVDRERLNTLLAEQDFSQTGRIDAATAVRAGKIVGVKYFLTGALTEWEHGQSSGHAGRLVRGLRGRQNKFSAAMNARLIDAETGDILWADEASANERKFRIDIAGLGGGSDYTRNTISTLIKPMVEELAQKLAASGF